MITVSWTTLWRILIFSVFVAVLFLGRDFILALFLAIVISSGLEAPLDAMERRGLPRVLGVILLFFGGALLLALLVYFIIPFMLIDVNAIFGGTNQAAIGKILSPLRGTEAGRSFSEALNQMAREYISDNGSPLQFFSKALGGAVLGITILISSFYLSLTNDGVERFIRAVFPKDGEWRALKIYHRVRRKIGIWFRTQLLLSVIIGIIVWIALAFLGVRHAFLLGVIAAIFELLPFVGPIISGFLAVMIALTTSASLGLYTLIVFLLIQQFENHFLVPMLTKRAVDIHPVIVIIALLIGFEINGILGALVAVPLAAVVQEIIEARSLGTPEEQAEAVL